MKTNLLKLIFLSTIFLFIGSAKAAFVSYTYFGDGGVIPDNCYPENCDIPSLDKFESSIFVNEDFIVSDVIFTISWSHSASTDIISFALDGPSGSAGITSSRPCMDREGGTYTFSDNSTNEISFLSGDSCSFGRSPSGEYKPAVSFDSFIGDSAYGDWNLSIFDGFSRDEGFVQSWELTLVTEVSSPGAISLIGLALLGMGFNRRNSRKKLK